MSRLLLILLAVCVVLFNSITYAEDIKSPDIESSEIPIQPAEDTAACRVAILDICLITFNPEAKSSQYIEVGHTQYNKNNYLGLELGLFFPFGGVNEKYRGYYQLYAGLAGGLKYIRYFNENVGVIVNVTRIGAGNWREKEFGYGDALYKGRCVLDSIGLGWGLALRFPINEDGRINFVASGGLSGYINSMEIRSSEYRSTATGSYAESYHQKTGITLGYFADAGFRFYQSSWLAFETVLRYTINEMDILDYHGNKIGTADMSGISTLLSFGVFF